MPTIYAEHQADAPVSTDNILWDDVTEDNDSYHPPPDYDRHSIVMETTGKPTKHLPAGEPPSARKSRPKRHCVTCPCVDTASNATSEDLAVNVTVSAPGTKHCKVLSDRCMTGILVAVGLLGIAVPAALGVYALLIVKPGPVIDKSIKSFAIPNHRASKHYDALQKADSDMRILVLTSQESQRGRRDLTHHEPRSKREAVPSFQKSWGFTQSRRQWKLQFYYVAQGGPDPNIFTKERLSDIHAIEQRIMSQPRYTDFCHIDYNLWVENPNLGKYRGCAPMNSLLTYFYPTVIGNRTNGTVTFDSYGSKQNDINETLSLAMTHPSFFWYVDDRISSSYKHSRLMRSELHFGTPIAGFRSFSFQRDEQVKEFLDFLTSYIPMLDKASTPRVRVLYGGTQLYDYLVTEIFWADLRLTVFAGAAILVLMYVLTGLSVWLTLWGTMAILLSFPLTLFFYRVVFSRQLLGILNGVATFVVIGIGVDDVFVFINTFRQTDHQMSLQSRLYVTVTMAGKATFFTSATTAAAFAANVASSIPAVHDFGLFMSIIVLSCWVMVMWIIPPALAVWAMVFVRCEGGCYSCCNTCVRRQEKSLPSELASVGHTKPHPPPVSGYDNPVMSWLQDQPEVATTETSGQSQLQNLSHDGGWTTYYGALNAMLQSDNEASPVGLDAASPPVTPDRASRGCDLTHRMQVWTYKYIARPVIRGRWIVLALYLALLLAAGGLTSQLSPATKPPQLFQSDTNLQSLLDLAANFSHRDIDCNRCSGAYMTGSKELLKPEPKVPNFPPPPKAPTTTTPQPTTSKRTTRATRATPKPATTPTTKTTTTTTTTTTITTTTTTTNPLLSSNSPSTQTTTTTTTPPPTEPPPTTTTTATTTQKPTTTPPTEKPTTTPKTTVKPTAPPSTPATLGLCTEGRCDAPDARPVLGQGASVYVVFGIKELVRGQASASVLSDQEDTLVMDAQFSEAMSLRRLLIDRRPLRDLCEVCHYIANNTRYVVKDGAQCLPQYINTGLGGPVEIAGLLRDIPECAGLPVNQLFLGNYLPARAKMGYRLEGNDTGFYWVAFSFASTTYKGQSYFSAYSDYQAWETLIRTIREDVLDTDSPLQSVFQTSEFWPQVMMEVVAVNSAIYGLLFSLLICVSLVAVFTGHVLLLLIVVLTILGVVLLVVAIFYLVGWEMGAVEAVSLSILVGSSVDYCAHLVEGYLQAGTYMPEHLKQSPAKARRWRSRSAVSHIGVSIISSAITTVIAAIPLTQTTIIPFSKFGQIVAINTTVSIVYTLTACTGFLGLFAPALYRRTWRSVGIATAVTVAVVMALVLALFTASRFGYHIPGPSGEDLFPVPVERL